MDFAYIFRVLLRRKWIILLCTFLALISAYFFTKNMQLYYKSSAQLSTGFTVAEEIKLSEDRFNAIEIDVKFNNVIENINSSKVLSLLSYQLMLRELTSENKFRTLTQDEVEREKVELAKVDKNTIIKVLTERLAQIQQLTPTIDQEKAILKYIDIYKFSIGEIRSNLNVGRYQRTDYINIDYLSEHPQLSAFAVNMLCTEFKRFYGLNKRERNDNSVSSLDSLVQKKREILNQKRQDKSDFMSSQGVLDVTLQGSNNMSQISTFESQLIEERANQTNYTYQIRQLGNQIDDARRKGLTTIVDATQTQTSTGNTEYLRLWRQYNDLNTEYIEKGGNDPELKRKMDNISREMAKIKVDEGVGGGGEKAAPVTVDQLVQRKLALEGLLASTTQKISAIESKLRQLRGGLSGMATKGATIEQLDKEIEIAAAEYRDANDRYNMALNMNESVPGSFKQTMMGEPALLPEPSKKLMILAMSGMAAMLISSLIFVGIEFFDNSVKTPSQFQRITGLNLLGTINWVKFSEGSVLDKVTLFEQKENRANIFRELLRKLRYELENSNKRIYLFTSTEPQQGKTTLIQSLAYSLSLSKKRVLIIDTNFCNNDLTVATGASPVLEKFSLNGMPFDADSIKDYVTSTSAEGVDVIGCAGGDYTPSEILPKNHLLNYLDKLKENYDYIFLEGAPLNVYTDTKELVKYADGVIAIFSAESVFSAADKESIEFLHENKDKFIGAVLNKVQEANLNF